MNNHMIEEIISRYVSTIRYENMDIEMRHIIKRNLLDSYASICASLLDVGMLQKFSAMASIPRDQDALTVWGIGEPAHVTEAVFMNTILGRRSDLVNTYLSPGNMGGSHPSDNVSLILSLADWLNKSGKDVLVSTYAAYMLSCAFSDYYDPESNRFDHDAAAVFYTPLIIGYMQGLPVGQLIEAQRIAGAMGLGINQAALGEVTDWKHCTYASCALRGMSSVRMAQAGFRGPVNIYDGIAGVNRFMRHGNAFLNSLPDLKQIIFKRWPALVFTQTPIDTAIALAGQIKDYRKIKHVRVETYRKAIEEAASSDETAHPGSRAGRTHSLFYCVSVALIKGAVEFSYFDDDFVRDNKPVLDLMEKISISEDSDMTKSYPGSSPCRITVTMDGAEPVAHRLDRPHGDPSDPLTDEEISNKARKYMTLLMPEDEALRIIDRIWQIENEWSADPIIEPLKRKRWPIDDSETERG